MGILGRWRAAIRKEVQKRSDRRLLKDLDRRGELNREGREETRREALQRGLIKKSRPTRASTPMEAYSARLSKLQNRMRIRF